ncbi:carbohydrate ABC transporter membrane protein 1, CUT1 family [Agromyces sp. CF514]|uniref:carbohydrate ABC transporter permease n=1 Tax=Agromyces sp. CF514 TaxID=1881031 RepID=UPI0008DF570E|nr:sugar ABC transporter permease [Agromyces sp. CF514]SFR68093.1 carbohydrate ABC transporter membrane protein 1, CUT1 family [Agromyces sp. CF514]
MDTSSTRAVTTADFARRGRPGLAGRTAPETPAPGGRASRRSGNRWRTPLLFLLPFGVLFIAMYVVPIAFAFVQSLFTLQRSGLGLEAPTLEFTPLANYARLMGDAEFMSSLGRVALFGIVQVPVMLGLALGLALLLDSKSARGKGFFRLAAFLPYAVPGVIAAVMWSFLYSPVTSPINTLLERAVGSGIPFFAPEIVLWAVANIVTWGWTGYNMLIIYSSLQTIPAETIEAARLDGAGAFRIAWSIKIPMVRPALVLTAVFSIIGSAQLYNEPKVLQTISGGAISNTFTPLMAAQAQVTAQNYPYAAAQSVVLALLVGVLSFAFFKLTNRGDR